MISHDKLFFLAFTLLMTGGVARAATCEETYKAASSKEGLKCAMSAGDYQKCWGPVKARLDAEKAVCEKKPAAAPAPVAAAVAPKVVDPCESLVTQYQQGMRTCFDDKDIGCLKQYESTVEFNENGQCAFKKSPWYPAVNKLRSDLRNAWVGLMGELPAPAKEQWGVTDATCVNLISAWNAGIKECSGYSSVYKRKSCFDEKKAAAKKDNRCIQSLANQLTVEWRARKAAQEKFGQKGMGEL